MIIKSISEILRGRSLVSIAPDASIREACAALDRHNIGALAVMEGDRLTGILSERDVIRRCIAQERPTGSTRVAEVMSPDPVTVNARESLANAMAIMLDGGFRHLPVERAGEIVGMLSMRDIPTEYRLMAERWREHTGEAQPA